MIEQTDGGMATAHVLRKARPGHVEALEAKIAAILALAAREDGYVGSAVMRMRSGEDTCISALVHFASRPQLKQWKDSAVARVAFAATTPHLAEPARVEFAEGAAGWFTLPDTPRHLPPAKWKMALISWLAIFPTLTLFISVSFHLLGDVPMIARLFLNTILIAPLMTWVIMPLMTRLFGRWLFPR